MHTHLYTLPHLHIGIFACSLHAGKLSNATSAKFLHHWPVISPWQSSPWRWDLATDTAGSMKSLLSFCWGQWEPIRKLQWFCVLLWAHIEEGAHRLLLPLLPPPYLMVLSFWLRLVHVPDLVKHPSCTQGLVWHPGIRLNSTLHLYTTVLGSNLLVAIQWVGVKP